MPVLAIDVNQYTFPSQDEIRIESNLDGLTSTIAQPRFQQEPFRATLQLGSRATSDGCGDGALSSPGTPHAFRVALFCCAHALFDGHLRLPLASLRLAHLLNRLWAMLKSFWSASELFFSTRAASS